MSLHFGLFCGGGGGGGAGGSAGARGGAAAGCAGGVAAGDAGDVAASASARPHGSFKALQKSRLEIKYSHSHKFLFLEKYSSFITQIANYTFGVR